MHITRRSCKTSDIFYLYFSCKWQLNEHPMNYIQTDTLILHVEITVQILSKYECQANAKWVIVVNWRRSAHTTESQGRVKDRGDRRSLFERAFTHGWTCNSANRSRQPAVIGVERQEETRRQRKRTGRIDICIYIYTFRKREKGRDCRQRGTVTYVTAL